MQIQVTFVCARAYFDALNEGRRHLPKLDVRDEIKTKIAIDSLQDLRASLLYFQHKSALYRKLQHGALFAR